MMKSTVGIKWKQNEANVKCKPIFLCEKPNQKLQKVHSIKKILSVFLRSIFLFEKKMTIYHSISIFRTR